MSSSNKKTFKTSETSKQADATVTSDAILLEPTTTDHVLVVTSDSAANLTGDVNVELEMSPDGVDWCPVQTKTTTTTAGTTTQGQVGNTLAVDMAGDTRDKFARGRLEYNLSDGLDYSGIYPDQERARKDGSDFVHHMIAVNKSFNYSGWYNSDVQPSSTYTPILFRNGGIDLFENTKTIELTDTSGTFFNEYAIEANPVGDSAGHGLYQNNSFMLGVDTTATTNRESFSVSFWVKNPTYLASVFEMRAHTATNKYTSFGVAFHSGGNISILIHNTTGNAQAQIVTPANGWNSGWNHVVVNTVASGSSSYYWEFIINGATPQTTSTLVVPTLSSSSLLNHAFGILGQWYGSFTGTYGSETPAGGGGTGPMAIDEFAVWNDVLTQTDAIAMYNGASPTDLTGSTNLHRYYRFKDGANDTGTSIENLVNPGATDAITSSSDYTIALSSGTDGSMYVTPDKTTQNLCEPNTQPFSSIFSVSNSFSISGWFKTTDTGTLFSDTGGTATSGLKVDVTSSGITASYLDSNLSTSVTGTFNDGDWHHISMVMSPGSQLIVVDNISSGTSNHTLLNADLRGSNTFTLLGDGQHNANAASPASTDASKLNATLSNWSVHSEALSAEAISHLYSNGHVRNLKNLPSVDPLAIEAFWQLNDTTNPENDLSGNNYHLQYQSPAIWGNEQYIEGISAPFSSIGEGIYKEVNNGGFFSSGQSTSESGGSRNYFYGYNNTLNFWLHVPSNYTADTESIPLLVDYNDTTGTTDYFLYVQYYPSTNTLRYGGKNSGAQTGINVKLDNTDGEGDVTGQWCMVTILLGTDPGAATCYINGNLRTSTSFGSGTSRPSSSVSINASLILGNGNRAQNSTAFPAYTGISGASVKIDNIDCFVDTLTSTEISNIYNSGTPKDASTVNSTIYQSLKFETGDGDSETTINCQVSNVQYDKNSAITDTYLTSFVNTDPMYTQGGSTPLNSELVDADGATLVQNTLNGNAMTLSLTKNFDFVSESWVTDASGDAAFCLSFNGHEEQAEYFALWKCSQVSKSIDFLDGSWHNVVLSYRASTAEGQNVRFGPLDDIQNKQDFNWNLSVNGLEYNDINSSIGADYIGGLNALLVESVGGVNKNTGFAIYNRHLKYDTANNEEIYITHGQAGSNISEDSGANSPNAYQGAIDETSFHSQNFWVSSGGEDATNFESEYPATIYGNTTALTGLRGAGSAYETGVPYPLNNPDSIGANSGTSQYINPNRYDASTNPGGGLEAWWRWGDTPTDCAENINDAIDYELDITNNNHDLRAQNFDQLAVVSPTTTPDSTTESIYKATTQGTTGSATIALVNVVIEGIVDTACNVKDLALPVLQYLRVKFKGTGSTDLGDGKTEASLWYAKRRKR